jgi:serine/threonine-protein kinase RsbW
MPKQLLMTDATAFKRQFVSPPDDVELVHDLLNSVWSDSSNIGSADRFSFETALVELAANIIRHADIGIGISYSITVQIFDDRLEATVTDNGEHTSVEHTETDMPDDLSESGRGIPLINALVDHFSFDRDGDFNRWQIIRKLTS